MFGFLDRILEVDQIDENDNESSPMSRAVEAAKETLAEAAEALVNDDMETIAEPPSSSWKFW